jgi:hypothetical protein
MRHSFVAGVNDCGPNHQRIDVGARASSLDVRTNLRLRSARDFDRTALSPSLRSHHQRQPRRGLRRRRSSVTSSTRVTDDRLRQRPRRPHLQEKTKNKHKSLDHKQPIDGLRGPQTFHVKQRPPALFRHCCIMEPCRSSLRSVRHTKASPTTKPSDDRRRAFSACEICLESVVFPKPGSRNSRAFLFVQCRISCSWPPSRTFEKSLTNAS